MRVRGLGKRFGGTVALDGLDLDIAGSSVLALVGPNGAGKSTLIQILAGIHHADAGHVWVAGDRLGSRAAARRMAFVHQDPALVEWMTVAENIALGLGYPRSKGLISQRRVQEQGSDVLTGLLEGIDPRTRAGELSRAERSMVAVARALAADADLVVLDEPTVSLSAVDSARLFRALHRLRDRGRAVLYVSHRLDEVYQVADRFAVLRDGQLLREGALAVHGPTRLLHDIVGQELTTYQAPPAPTGGAALLRVRRVRTPVAGPVDVDVLPGEVVGMTGLTGAGHESVGRALAGLVPLAEGDLRLAGRPYRPASVAEAVGAGVSFVGGDRLEEGGGLDLTVRENLFPNPRATGRRTISWIRPRDERAGASSLIERFRVRPSNSEAPLATLSGGNQQKVVIGRWLGLRRRLMVLEEPTAGVDVGAKAEIHRLLAEEVTAGLAVVLVSSDFEELVRVCHRVLVFVRGQVAAELTGPALSVSALVRTTSMTAPPSAAPAADEDGR